jgi:hypothetical protein
VRRRGSIAPVSVTNRLSSATFCSAMMHTGQRHTRWVSSEREGAAERARKRCLLRRGLPYREDNLVLFNVAQGVLQLDARAYGR